MKKAFCVLALALLGTSACQQTGPDIAAESTRPAVFEIRDFSLDNQIDSLGVKIQGRGTLVAKDARLAKGTFLVLLAVKRAHADDAEEHVDVLLKEGIATINVNTFQLHSDKDKNERVRYYDWRVVGYFPLYPGTIQSGGSKSSG